MEQNTRYEYEEKILAEYKTPYRLGVNVDRKSIYITFKGEIIMWLRDYIQLKKLAHLFQKSYEKAKIITFNDEEFMDDDDEFIEEEA